MTPSRDDCPLVPLTLHLPEDVVDWLSDHAEQHDESVDRLVCRLLTGAGSPTVSETGTEEAPADRGAPVKEESSPDHSHEDTVLGCLRRAQEKLKGLRGEEAAGTIGTESGGEERSDAAGGPPSMFELVEDDE
jgi:hypothetical protein